MDTVLSARARCADFCARPMRRLWYICISALSTELGLPIFLICIEIFVMLCQIRRGI